MKVSIDRITFCGNEYGSLEMFVANNDYIKNTGFAKYPYRTFITFLDGSILQVGEKSAVSSGKIKELRYEFNPNNKTYEKIHFSVLKMLKDVHCTRLDIAFDVFDVDMSEWEWIDKKSRQQVIYYDGQKRKETVYIGGKDSNIRTRIYNKAVEQKQKDKVWWRVELQLRGEEAEKYRVWSRQYKGLVPLNPFLDISPVRNVEDGLKDLDIKERAMVMYLMKNQAGFSELSGKTKKKYKELIIKKYKSDLIDFEDLWNKKSSDVGSELDAWFLFTNQIHL